MAIKNVTFTIKGDHELLLHSNKSLNPYTPESMEVAAINAKKKNKTDADELRLSDLEFIQSIYWDEENQRVYIPGYNIEKCIREGAQLRKRGKDIQRYVTVVEDKPELHYGKRLTLEQLVEDKSFRDVRGVKVRMSQVLRTRPRFNPGWTVTFTVRFDDNNIDIDVIRLAIEEAGAYIGLGDFRPRYGTFVIAE